MEKFKDKIDDEKLKFIEDNRISLDETFKLSRLYSEILLTSIPVKTEGELGAIFKHEAIDSFAEGFKSYTNEKTFSDDEKRELFKIINDIHTFSITEEEMRKLPSVVIPADEYLSKPIGVNGKYYLCDYIPEDIVNKIEMKIFE